MLQGAPSPRTILQDVILSLLGGLLLLCVLITAPLGAWCIAYYAPKMLTKKTPTDDGSV